MPYFFAILDKTHRKALFALHCIVALTAVDSNLDQKYRPCLGSSRGYLAKSRYHEARFKAIDTEAWWERLYMVLSTCNASPA